MLSAADSASQNGFELFWACLALAATVFIGIPEIWKRRKK